MRRLSISERMAVMLCGCFKLKEPIVPSVPSLTLPGTVERLSVYRERVAAGEHMTHSEDAKCFDDLGDTPSIGTSSYYGDPELPVGLYIPRAAVLHGHIPKRWMP